MEEVLLVVAVVGGIAWWMHGGSTPAQGQTPAAATEQAQPATPAPPAPIPPAPSK